MNKIFLALVLFSIDSAYSQGIEIDTTAFKEKFSNIEIRIGGAIQAAYLKNDTIFNDGKGKTSPVKVLQFIRTFLQPEWEDIYRYWAKKVLDEKQYKAFCELKFSYNHTTGIPVLSLQQTIEYDMRWMANFYSATSLFLSDMTASEYLYYLTSSEMTGILQPPYIDQFLNNMSMSEWILKEVSVHLPIEFFIIMHEFYHLTNNQEKLSPIEKEMTADIFAFEKYKQITKSKQNDKLSNYNYKEDLKKLGLDSKSTYEKFNEMFNAYPQCNSEILFNEKVKSDDLSAFIGIRSIEQFLLPDSRYYLTNPEQLELDLSRSQYFYSETLKALSCESDVQSFFCCRVRTEEREIYKMKELHQFFKSFDGLAIEKSKEFYLKSFPKQPTLIPYNIGNHFAKIGDFKKAASYYYSVNELFENDDYAVLCNLLAYEIFANVKGHENKSMAGLALNKAKLINEKTHTIRRDIIDKLKVD